MKCKVCGNNGESEYCFRHKPRKPLSKTSSKLRNSLDKTSCQEKLDRSKQMPEFFMLYWKKMPHYSEVSGKYLGSEAMSTYFHHILPKEKYPEASLDEENIILLTLDEHTNVESDIYKYEEVNRRREQLKQKYNLS